MPRGRIASNSGCTEVLVDGAMTANFLRKPRESAMGQACRRWPAKDNGLSCQTLFRKVGTGFPSENATNEKPRAHSVSRETKFALGWNSDKAQGAGNVADGPGAS